jgi:SGNH domain (fused to AT3 domains)
LNIKKIVLLGPPATWLGDGLVANILDYYYQHAFHVIPARTKFRSNDAWTRHVDAWLRMHAEELGITYISVRNLMCNDDGCLARIGENDSDVTAFDWGHLTKAGSIFVVGSILDQLLDKRDAQ